MGLLVYWGQIQKSRSVIYYSGTIEATTSQLGFQVGGKVAAVNVREGQGVEREQVLAELDPADYRAQLDQANANVERLQRQVGQLQANLGVLQRTLPADVAKAEAGVTSAKATLEEATRDKDRYTRLFKEEIVSVKDRDSVYLRYDTASAQMQDAAATLVQAKSNLSKIYVQEKEIAAAQAQVKAGQAAARQAELQLHHSQLKAPYQGTIVSRNIEPGEIVTPSRQALTISDLSVVKLKIFVGETEIGLVKPGQKVDVKTDTFPGKVYRGMVSFISPEGEFTPKIIQTHKERVKLVYLVEVSVPNSQLELKSGMPADAWLR